MTFTYNGYEFESRQSEAHNIVWLAGNPDDSEAMPRSFDRDEVAEHFLINRDMPEHKTEANTVTRDEVRARLAEMKAVDHPWKDELDIHDFKYKLTEMAVKAFDQEIDPVELVAGIVWAQEVIGEIRDFENNRQSRIRQILQEDIKLKAGK